jgi:hypothetical protein
VQSGPWLWRWHRRSAGRRSWLFWGAPRRGRIAPRAALGYGFAWAVTLLALARPAGAAGAALAPIALGLSTSGGAPGSMASVPIGSALFDGLVTGSAYGQWYLGCDVIMQF